MPEIASSDAMGRCAIADVAVYWSYLERPRSLSDPSHVNLSEAFARGRRQIYGTIYNSTVARHYRLENVILDAETLQLLVGSRTIRETEYFVPKSKPLARVTDEAQLIELHPDEDTIIGYNNAHAAYNHWLVQCLPAIDWSLRQPRTRPARLVLPQLNRWQERTLEILGYETVPRLNPASGRQYLIPHAEYTDHLSGQTTFSICLTMLETAHRLASGASLYPSKERLVYVHEPSPYYGRIENIDEVLETVRSRGIRIFDMRGSWDVDAAISLFRHAEVVFGPHGQGLTNVVFCRPGTILWEWMPDYFENAIYNRLAQTARVDYWADLFSGSEEPSGRKAWSVDLRTLSNRLDELCNRPSRSNLVVSDHQKQGADRIGEDPNAKPLDEIMLSFESLGDNCEFGLVQRHAGVEPLGLLRFASIFVPTEIRMGKVIEALRVGFEGLGRLETITVNAPTGREYMVNESVYKLMYHSGVDSAEMSPEEVARRETRRLSFLQSKLVEDLRTAAKIFVWRCPATDGMRQIHQLLDVLRAYGPNKLLWVVEQDNEHPAGTVELLESDLAKGYIQRFAPYENATDIVLPPWYEVCRKALRIFSRPAIVGSAYGAVEGDESVETTPRSNEDPMSKPAAGVRHESGASQENIGTTRIRHQYETFDPSSAPRGDDQDDVLGYFYDVGGLNNQKMSLISLLLTALARRRPVRIPYVQIKDQRTNSERLARFKDVFEARPIEEWALEHRIYWDFRHPIGERGAYKYFSEFSTMLAKDSHPVAVRATLELIGCLKPRIETSTAHQDFKAFVFGNLRVNEVLQLRIEADWETHAANLRTSIGREEDFDISFPAILKKFSATFPDSRMVYVTSDELSMPVPKSEIKKFARDEFGISLVFKSDYIDLDQYNPLDLSLIDFDMARSAPAFIGNSLSTFANMACLEKFSRTRAPVRGHYVYNHPRGTLVERHDNGFSISPFEVANEGKFNGVWVETAAK